MATLDYTNAEKVQEVVGVFEAKKQELNDKFLEWEAMSSE